ncbi:MAG TPA: DNA-processing protein DprA [Candidatus Nanoarchaeia archaeon]|nr:DNA-processing protein DprA [Candidatus Nanoarchaeia archaeon]
MQISKITHNSSKYPDLLREIAHPPKQLFMLGELPEGPYVAIVGSRAMTDYGKQVTFQLAGDLARAGCVIVSGLAYGIDAIAHQATVEAGGKAVAVLAHGLDQIYPVANRTLAKKILAGGGALVSEYEVGVEAFKSNFVARNRIIAGLSKAIIVTEANAESGSLITANFGLEENRLVMAVPGNITSPRSAGPNNLLKKGAVPVTDSSDVLPLLDLPELKTATVKARSKEEATLLELLGQGVNSSEALIDQSGLSAAQFANIITLMEITGKVRNLGAGQWVSRSEPLTKRK